MRHLRLILLIAISTVAVVSAQTTKPLLHQLFTNNMVLQRDAADPVWGWTQPGASVSVTVFDQNGATLQEKTATAGSDGRWQTTVGPFSLVPGNAAYSLSVSGPGETKTISNILIGDVWLCSGQSNMEYTLYGNYPEGSGGTRLANSTNEIAAAQAAASAPYIRQFKASHAVASAPQSTFVGGVDSGGWTLASSNARAFTAIGYFMAKQIYDSQQVPIGLLALNWGGTSIHPWVPADYLRTIADFTPTVDTLAAATVTSSSPCAIFNAMIAPAAGFQIKGAVWYQGENEGLTLYGVPPSGGPKYQAMLKQYLAGTRAAFGQPSLPFVLVQLSTNGSNTTPVQSSTTTLFAEVREAQLNTALDDSNTRLVTTVDCGFGGSNADIHPIDKQTPGKRVGEAALNLACGQPTEYRTPTFNHATVEGGAMRCYFDHVGSGLMVGLKPQGLSQNAAPSPSPVSEVSGGTLTGFSIAGSDKTWYAATATIDPATNTVVVSSPSVASPLYVRYGWCDNPWNTASGTPLCNLYRKILNESTVVDGVPVSPFRNDPAYQLSVNGGTPSGMNYTPEQVVAVTAAGAPSGQAFAFWTGDTSVLASTTSPSTTATLSQPYVSVRAIYQLNAAPTGLAATAGALKATLSWNALANAASYNIKRATSADGPYTTIATGVVATSYTDNSTGSGTTFYYKISATNLAGESPDSASVSVQPLNAAPVNAAWNTDAATGDFSSPNWTGSTTTPAAGGNYTVASGDSLFFGSSTTTTLNNNLSGATYGGLTFNSGASAFTIGGNSFTLSGGITNNSSSAQAINTAITLSNAGHTFNAANGNVTLGGAIGGTTTQGVTFSGSGTTTLSGTNTFNTKGANFSALTVTSNLSVTGSTTVDGTGFTDYRGYLGQSGNSTITVQSGGSLAINTSTKSDMNSTVGQDAIGTSTLLVAGGSFSINGGGGFALGNNKAGATGVLTISSGTATINRGSTTATDIRSFIAMGRDTANGTINLNGGVLATDRNFVRDGNGAANGGTANFNFGGGTLKALANQTDWLNSSLKNTNQQALSAVTATGTSTIDANGFSVAISSNISGTGGFSINSSTGTGTVTLGGANTYTGDTTVEDGILAVNSTAIPDTGKLVINGGKVQPTGTEVVDTLFFGAAQQAAGTWGATGSGAQNINDTYFSGTGVVSVATGPAAGYTTWADANAPGQTMDQDHDNDGVDNGVEYFMGKSDSSFTANPTPVNGTVTWPMGDGYLGVYGTDYEVQTSIDLVTWTPVGSGSVTVTAGTSVVYDMPTGGGKLFVRLVVKN